MSQTTATSDQARTILGRPSLIFFTELDGSSLQDMLSDEGLLDELAQQQYGIALAMLDLGSERAEIVRQLNTRGICTIAWLLLPPTEGFWFNIQNYPQAVEQFRAFYAWAQQHQLQFEAVGLDIEPPVSEVLHIQQWGLRDIARRTWLARENVLYPAARAAYNDLIAEIHQAGYEVHTYQLPLLADDRRIGTTLVQRALDIVDLPADVEVLMCYSSIPIEGLGNDLGGALIASYGPSADSIGIGITGSSGANESTCEGLPPLSWEALERDILLAAQHTDTIYIFSLEGCVERGLLTHLANLDWDREPRLLIQRRLQVEGFRLILFIVLLLARFSQAFLAWVGWGLAAILLLREIRHWWTKRARSRESDM
ncbi:MAG: hypothetical protein MI924_22910 [Chloroflexales bacterium]|nr:hypothetical protein [Chloroflexales bacterium]